MTTPHPSLHLGLVLPLSLLSGLLLGLAGPPLFAPWLTLVALIPFLAVLLHPGTRPGRAALAAVCVGIGQDGVLAYVLEFPLGFALLLTLGFAALWAAAGAVAAAALRRLPVGLGPLAAAATITLAEYLATLIPGFGTAQSFARSLAPWPVTLQVAAVAGIAGVVFVLVLGQGAVALAIVQRTQLRRLAIPLAVYAGVVAAAAVFSVARMSPETQNVVRVAAVGWTHEEVGQSHREPGGADGYHRRVLAPMIREAAADGADLVVTPEVALWLRTDEIEPVTRTLSALARETGATLVVGYFDVAADDNHATVIGPDGSEHGNYVKTHLIPGYENYTAGDGARVSLTSPAARIGVMICQDDNFPGLARGYSRDHVSLLVVPTNDWLQVQEFHLQNVVVRSIDSGFAIVRGASHGISAIIDARGRVIARRDHHDEGAGPLLADLPLYRPGTLHAHAGAWLPILCFLFLAGTALLGRREE